MSAIRYKSIDIAKAIAIILVVIGHYFPSDSPYWYTVVHDVIYTFHMPLFMMASGFLYIATRRERPYGEFIVRKFKRLMVPYFSASIIIIVFKLLSQGSMQVDNPVTLMTFVEIFYRPAAGFFLWFIWALWWIFMIIPLFTTRTSRLILAAVACVLCYIPWHLPEIFCLKQTQDMLVYFMVGVMVYDYRQYLRRFTTLYCGIGTVVVFTACEYLRFGCGIVPVTDILLPYLGIAAVMYLSREIERFLNYGKAASLLLKLSGYTYFIYLFHTTFMGLAKGVCSKIPLFGQPQDAAVFLTEVIIVTFAGLAIPVIVDKWIVKRWNLLGKLFGM